MVTIAFMQFQNTIARQFGNDAELRAMDHVGRKRNWIALIAYAVAIPAAYVHPGVSLSIVVCISALYFVPDALTRK